MPLENMIRVILPLSLTTQLNALFFTVCFVLAPCKRPLLGKPIISKE